MQILFVCTGNTCRSPLAEAIARKAARDRALPNVRVVSAGTSACADSPASDGSLLVAMENGLDLADHRAQQLSPELVGESTLIFTMGPHHLERVDVLGGIGKSWLLTAFVNGEGDAWPVSDPFGGDLEGYRATFGELDREVQRIMDRVARDHSHPTR